MANDLPGLQLLFVQHVVNVQWSGLAVEFGREAEDAPEPSKQPTTARRKKR